MKRMQFTVYLDGFGNLPSAKNRRQIAINQKTGKHFIVESREVKKVREIFGVAIRKFRREHKIPPEEIIFPAWWGVIMRITYENNRPDLSMELVFDFLQDFNVVKNDRYRRFGEDEKKIEKGGSKVELYIYETMAPEGYTGRGPQT